MTQGKDVLHFRKPALTFTSFYFSSFKEWKKISQHRFLCFCLLGLLSVDWFWKDFTLHVHQASFLFCPAPCTFALCVSCLTLESTGVQTYTVAWVAIRLNEPPYVKPWDPPAPSIQVLQEVEVSPCWAPTVDGKITCLMFLSSRKADVPWRTVGQVWAVYLPHFPSAKIHLQGPWQWEVEPEVQNGHHGLPSQPPPLCGPSVLKLSRRESRNVCPLKALAPAQKGGLRIKSDSERRFRNWTPEASCKSQLCYLLQGSLEQIFVLWMIYLCGRRWKANNDSCSKGRPGIITRRRMDFGWFGNHKAHHKSSSWNLPLSCLLP